MQKLKTMFVLSLAALLPACGAVMETASQEVRLDTPGAYEAECTLNNGIRYIGRTGQTLNIQKSRLPLNVECYAAGNRYKQVIVESVDSNWALGNIATAGVGFAYDHYSGAMYKYPDVITVDFVGVPTEGFELPDYHLKDAPNPYKQSIEDFSPSTPKAPTSEKTYLRRGTEKREGGKDMNPFATPDVAAAMENVPAMTPTAEGTTAKTTSTTTTTTTTTTAPAANGAPPVWGKDAESLNRAMNPKVFGDK